MKVFIDSFDRRFGRLYDATVQLVEKIPPEKLYWQPREIFKDFPFNSCGEYVLRSAGKIEQAFGGITVKLWDDPFEWTLPEQLSTNDLILNYLSEVEATRRRGFALFQSDDDLKKQIPAPENLVTIFDLLLDTLAVAENHLGRAAAVFRIFSDEKI